MTLPKIPVPQTLTTIDRVFNRFNANLQAELDWLNYSFGVCELLTKRGDNRLERFPAVYAGKNIEGEYLALYPDEWFGAEERLTAYSFIDMPSVDVLRTNPRVKGMIEGDFALIVWFNVSKLLSADEYRNLSLIVQKILKAVSDANGGFIGSILPISYTTRADEVFSGFSINSRDHKYLMHPFGGVRINCQLRTFEDCVINDPNIIEGGVFRDDGVFKDEVEFEFEL